MLVAIALSCLVVGGGAGSPASSFQRKVHHQSQVIVLTYHDIITQRDRNSVWFDTTIEEFKSQLAWLKKRRVNFVSVPQIEAFLDRKGKLPPDAVCITFSDNYLGFLLHAWPILRKSKIPSAQFVHTGFVGSNKGRKKMNWDQLRMLDRSGLVTIGSQTVSHPADLTKLSRAAVLLEFSKSKADLERELGHKIAYLAYPNGKFNRSVSNLAKNTGYSMAFTEECLPVSSPTLKWELPRFVHTKLKSALR